MSQLLLENNGKKTYGMVGSERVLTWTQGQTRFHIQASWSPTEPPRQDSTGLLNRPSGTIVPERGVINLYDDINAKWTMRGNENSSELLLDITWYCRAKPAGFTHYQLNASLSDPAQDARRKTLGNLAGRFRCY